jgi:spore maturation protein CgeB
VRIMVVHPGASTSTHDVFMGIQEALRELGHEVRVFPLDVKLAASEQFLMYQRLQEIARFRQPRNSPTELDVQLQACETMLIRCHLQKVDLVYIVSGMFVPLAVVQMLHAFGIKVVLHLTESPYDTKFEAKVAPYCAAVFTNERTAVPELEAVCPGPVKYIRHAWRTAIHRHPYRSLDASERLKVRGIEPDILFVGTGFPSRVRWLHALRNLIVRKRVGRLDLWGQYPIDMPRSLKKSLAGGLLDNRLAATLYQRARVGLNLYRDETGWTGEKVTGDSLSPRAYELAIAGCPHVSSPRAEVVERFGDLVPVAETPEEAVDALAMLRGESRRRRRARRAALQAAVAEDSWDDRITEIVPVLERL